LSKAIIVVDFAYKGPQRKGYGTGRTGLSSTLKYLQYRDKVQNLLAQNRNYERWQDQGMGQNWREIMKNSSDYQSQHVLAWTWVVSPAPDLMALIPEAQRRDVVCDLTERIVEDYYLERGFTIPEYSYILHDRQTDGEDMQQLHTHVVLPGTTPSIAERLPVYNNKSEGHDKLFREIATQHLSDILDETVGLHWQQERQRQEFQNLDPNDLEAWFD
jgi:hypothetical protein